MMAGFEDNRKRNLTEGDDISAILSSKRAALCETTASSGSDCQDHLLKILCPSAVAGSIIGRGGSVINQLNQMTGAKIKVSQNGEFFPTTNDRVLAISGSMTAISAAIHELVTKMIEAPDKKTNPLSESSPPANNLFQVRILIPSTASGVMIGRQGSVIRTMSESSSCVMQLAEMNDPMNVKERIMIVSSKDGNLPHLVHGVQLAMRQLFSDAVAGVYVNGRTSYGVPNSTTGSSTSLRAVQGSAFFPQQQHYNQGQAEYMLQGGGRGGPGVQGSDPTGGQMGAMGMDQGQYQQSRQLNYQQQQQHQQQQLLNQLQLQQQQQQQQQAYSGSLSYPQKSTLADITPPTYAVDGQSIKMTLGIPDSLVGSILGRQGCVVKEIMSLSGTVIQISQKDQYLPDTKNRAVSVVGLQHQIQIALSLIMTKAQGPAYGSR